MQLSKILIGFSILAPIVTCAQNERANHALVEKYVSLLSDGHYDSLVSLFTSPDSVYWVNGSPARSGGAAGNNTIAKRISGISPFIDAFDDFSLTITSIVAEGNLVSIEALGRGEGPGTLLYLQTTVMVFRIVGGKIDSLREYVDPEEALYLVSYRERYAQLEQGT